MVGLPAMPNEFTLLNWMPPMVSGTIKDDQWYIHLDFVPYVLNVAMFPALTGGMLQFTWSDQL